MNKDKLKKHHFWILLGLAPLLILIAVILINSEVGAAIEEKQSEIKKAQDEVAAKKNAKGEYLIKKMDKRAISLARRSGIQGLFILVARKERKLEVLASRAFRDVLTDARRQAIRAAFFEGFHRQDFNEGLKRGVAAIGEALATARRTGVQPRMVTGAALIYPSTVRDGFPSGIVNTNGVGVPTYNALVKARRSW